MILEIILFGLPFVFGLACFVYSAKLDDELPYYGENYTMEVLKNAD